MLVFLFKPQCSETVCQVGKVPSLLIGQCLATWLCGATQKGRDQHGSCAPTCIPVALHVTFAHAMAKGASSSHSKSGRNLRGTKLPSQKLFDVVTSARMGARGYKWKTKLLSRTVEFIWGSIALRRIYISRDRMTVNLPQHIPPDGCARKNTTDWMSVALAG